MIFNTFAILWCKDFHFWRDSTQQKTKRFNAQSYIKLKSDPKALNDRNEYFVTAKVFINERGTNLCVFTTRVRKKYALIVSGFVL